MPVWLQYLMQVISPTPHFVIFAQDVLYRGADFSIVWPEIVDHSSYRDCLFRFCFVPFPPRHFQRLSVGGKLVSALFEASVSAGRRAVTATIGDGMLVCDTENNPFLPGKGTRCEVKHSELPVLNEILGIEQRDLVLVRNILPPTGSPSIGAGRVQAGRQWPQKRGASARATRKTGPVLQGPYGGPGVGPMTASAMVAAIGDGAAFSRGRDFAAWLGLVPKQISTGDCTILGGISRRGNRTYARCSFKAPVLFSSGPMVGRKRVSVAG